ncbi:MAG: tyrosine-type recombinase/integrase [Anaerolineae bacterium]|jgi:integrase/recombinase XerD|nr:tyrosine-type recombinase/integrase [Anaerolineae bacterium]
MTVKEALEEFILAARADGIAKPTVKWYRAMLKNMAAEFDGRQLGEITASDLRRWIVSLEDRNLSEESIKSHKRAILRFWKWSATEYKIQNPAAGIKYPPMSKGNPANAITEDDVKLMLAAASVGDPVSPAIYRIRDVALIVLLIDTALRASALLSIDLKDVNLEKRYMLVSDKRKHGQVNIRRVPVSADAMPFLLKWIECRPPHKSHALFLALVGQGKPVGRLTYGGLYNTLKRIAIRGGVEGRFNPHAFRHGFGQRYMLGGGDPATASQLMGHSSITTTINNYGQFLHNDLGLKLDEFTPLKDVI